MTIWDRLTEESTRRRLTWRASGAADAVLGAVLAAVIVVRGYAVATSWGGGYVPFDCAAGAAAGAVALLRRRDRARAAWAGCALALAAVVVARCAGLPSEPGPALVLSLSVLVGSAVRALPAGRAGAVAAGGLAVVAVSPLGAPPSATGATFLAGLNAMGWLAALAAGLGLRLRDARHRATGERVRRDERLDLARELHDVVAHHITGVVLQAQAARLVAAKDPARLDAALTGIETAGSDALAAMRRVVGILRDTDDAAPAAPGPEDLDALVRRFGADGHRPRARLRLPERRSVWPAEVTSTVYRIVQEALTNVARHAPDAGSVSVNVEQDGRAVTVEVVDDAPAVPARRRPHPPGYGLVGMEERVDSLGGTLRAGPRPGGAGWSVRATLPLPAPR